MLIVDFSEFTNVFKITNFNFYKLLLISFFVFVILPKYIFPQDHIKDPLDKLMYNIIYMVATILAVLPFLVFFKIYSIVTLILAFILIKAALIYIFYKKNFFKMVREAYPPFFFKILRKLDDFYLYFSQKKYLKIKKIKNLNINYFKFFRNTFIFLFFVYAIYDINLINFFSLSNKAPDVSQFIEWVANLQKNILYADHKTGGADFYGQAIFVFFLQIISHIDSVILFSVYPSLLLIFILLGIYYVIYKTTDSHFSATFAISVYILYCLSPISKYLTGHVLATENPPILHIFNFKIYFATFGNLSPELKKELIDINSSPWARLNAGLAYEFSSSFFFLNIFFLIQCFFKKKLKYFILYACTLFCIFTFHGGGAILLVISSFLVFLNAIIFGKINFKVLKRGSLAILIPAIFGNMWLFSWLKYGIPQDFGNAAPILDKIFHTANQKKQLLEAGKEITTFIVYYKVQLFIFFLFLIFYFLSIIFFKKKRFIISSLSIATIGILLIFNFANLGFPRVVSQVRCADYLFLATAINSGLYFHTFERVIKFIFKKFAEWINMFIVTIFIACSLILVPTYNSTDLFFKYVNNIQYNSIALALSKIKTFREGYTFTVVGFVQSFSKVIDKGYHINIGTFLQKYNPYAPYLPIDTKYIFIIVENIPNTNFQGLNEWYYRWRKDLMENLKAWINIYSQYHNNIKIYFSSELATIYEIDNREYVKMMDRKQYLEKLKKFKNRR